jgi:hypothetical protein
MLRFEFAAWNHQKTQSSVSVSEMMNVFIPADAPPRLAGARAAW